MNLFLPFYFSELRPPLLYFLHANFLPRRAFFDRTRYGHCGDPGAGAGISVSHHIEGLCLFFLLVYQQLFHNLSMLVSR